MYRLLRDRQVRRPLRDPAGAPRGRRQPHRAPGRLRPGLRRRPGLLRRRRRRRRGRGRPRRARRARRAGGDAQRSRASTGAAEAAHERRPAPRLAAARVPRRASCSTRRRRCAPSRRDVPGAAPAASCASSSTAAPSSAATARRRSTSRRSTSTSAPRCTSPTSATATAASAARRCSGSSAATARPGFELEGGELPDYLPAILEFAALAPGRGRRRRARADAARDRAAARVAARHRQPLRDACSTPSSSTLPALSAEELAEARRIAARGPARRGGRPRAVRAAGGHAARRRPDDSARGVSRGATFLWVVLPYLAIAIVRPRPHLALPPRPVHLDDALDAAARGALAEDRQPAVPLRPARRDRRPRDRHPRSRKAWTDGLGISEDTYRIFSATMGTLAGVAMLAGLAILIARRLLNHRVAATTRGWDVTVMALLALHGRSPACGTPSSTT